MIKILEAGEEWPFKASPATRPDDTVSQEATSLTSSGSGVDRDLLRLECLNLALKQEHLTPDSVIAQAERMFAFVVAADREVELIAQNARVERAFESVKAAAIWAVTYAYDGALERGRDAGLDWLKFCMGIEFGEAQAKLGS